MGILDGKRILVAGVTLDSSIGFATAKVAQEQGATVLISNFGRALEHHQTDRQTPADRASGARARRHRTRTIWPRCRMPSASTSTASTASCTRSPTATRRRILGGKFLDGPWDDVAQAVHVSAYSLKSLAMACAPLMSRGGSVVGLTFDATVAWPGYDWMGVAKAALESTSRYLARDLGALGIRCNLVSAGPLKTLAAKAIPGFEKFEEPWLDRAPLGWDPTDLEPTGRTIVASAERLLPGDHRRDRARRRRLPRDGSVGVGHIAG